MNDKNIWFKLSEGKIKFIIAYFSLLIFLSFAIILSVSIVEFQLYCTCCVLTKSIIGSIGTSILGSSIFYQRKIYKSCINLDVSEPKSELDRIRELGVFLYFLLRPIFAMCFSTLLIILLKSGMGFMTDVDTLNDRFVYVSMLFSFIAGYSSGDIFDMLEEKGKSLVEKAIK